MPLRPQKRKAGKPGRPDNWLYPAIDEFPASYRGYYRVTSGPILSTDLLWNITARKWFRADWPGWTYPAPPDAAEAVYVLRQPHHEIAEGQSSRAYKLTRPPG